MSDKPLLPPEIVHKCGADIVLAAYLREYADNEWATVALYGKTQGATRGMLKILNAPGNKERAAEMVTALKGIGFKDKEDATPAEKEFAPLIVGKDPAFASVVISAQKKDIMKAMGLKETYSAEYLTIGLDEKLRMGPGGKAK